MLFVTEQFEGKLVFFKRKKSIKVMSNNLAI